MSEAYFVGDVIIRRVGGNVEVIVLDSDRNVFASALISRTQLTRLAKAVTGVMKQLTERAVTFLHKLEQQGNEDAKRLIEELEVVETVASDALEKWSSLLKSLV